MPGIKEFMNLHPEVQTILLSDHSFVMKNKAPRRPSRGKPWMEFSIGGGNWIFIAKATFGTSGGANQNGQDQYSQIQFRLTAKDGSAEFEDMSLQTLEGSQYATVTCILGAAIQLRGIVRLDIFASAPFAVEAQEIVVTGIQAERLVLSEVT